MAAGRQGWSGGGPHPPGLPGLVFSEKTCVAELEQAETEMQLSGQPVPTVCGR